MEYITLLSTAPSEEEAVKIANALLEKRLIACMNIIPEIRSLYNWKGKLCDETEVLMIMKTTKKNFTKIKTAFKKLHSYECPELIALDIADGLPNYLKWIDKNTDHRSVFGT